MSGPSITIAVIIEAMRAVWIAIALAACGSSQPAPPPVPTAKPMPPPDASVDASVDASRGQVAEALARMSAFRDEMCDCKDKPCAERVTEELTRWGQEIAARGREDQQRITEPEIRQMAEITETMTTCMTTAMLHSARHD